jgi:hypothetical protein
MTFSLFAPAKAPLIVAYGMGLDSTAVLVGLHQRGMRPDLILFADTGAEKPETYAYLPVIQAWLASVGFPPVTVVRYAPKTAPYTTLEGKCLANATLPSLAYGQHSCALVFKRDPQDKYVKAWAPAQEAWAAGQRCIKAIGYDNGDRDCARRAKADRTVARMIENGAKDLYEYWYPLQEWGVDRDGCVALIESAGLPVPIKSACWFCPASKKSEIVWLRDTHPVLFHRAVAMERVVATGKHGGGTTIGLGRTFTWESLTQADAAEIVDGPELARP